jgi:hypothetical protein
MKLLFNIRVFLWNIVFELENFLYPYKDKEPEVDYYYIIKNDETGEKYSVLEWIKSFDKRMEKIEDNFLYVESELNKINKLDLEILKLKQIIKNEKN